MTVLHPPPQQRVPCREGALDAPISQMGKWRSKAAPRAGSRGDLSSAFSPQAWGRRSGAGVWGSSQRRPSRGPGGGGTEASVQAPCVCRASPFLPRTQQAAGEERRGGSHAGPQAARARGRVMDSTAICLQSRRDGHWSDGGGTDLTPRGLNRGWTDVPSTDSGHGAARGGGQGRSGGQGGEDHTPSKGRTVAL